MYSLNSSVEVDVELLKTFIEHEGHDNPVSLT